jgi:hypothetical protein
MSLEVTDDVIEFTEAQLFAVWGPDINFRGFGFKIMQQMATDEAGTPDN